MEEWRWDSGNSVGLGSGLVHRGLFVWVFWRFRFFFGLVAFRTEGSGCEDPAHHDRVPAVRLG